MGWETTVSSQLPNHRVEFELPPAIAPDIGWPRWVRITSRTAPTWNGIMNSKCPHRRFQNATWTYLKPPVPSTPQITWTPHANVPPDVAGDGTRHDLSGMCLSTKTNLFDSIEPWDDPRHRSLHRQQRLPYPLGDLSKFDSVRSGVVRVCVCVCVRV